MCDTKDMLYKNCKMISEELEEIAENGFYTYDDDEDDEDGEYYFDDVYNTDYVFRSGVGFVGVCIMVACGGPNIYIDSYNEEVAGYWGRDEVHYPISGDVADRITDAFEDIAECDLRNFYN